MVYHQCTNILIQLTYIAEPQIILFFPFFNQYNSLVSSHLIPQSFLSRAGEEARRRWRSASHSTIPFPPTFSSPLFVSSFTFLLSAPSSRPPPPLFFLRLNWPGLGDPLPLPIFVSSPPPFPPLGERSNFFCLWVSPRGHRPTPKLVWLQVGRRRRGAFLTD